MAPDTIKQAAQGDLIAMRAMRDQYCAFAVAKEGRMLPPNEILAQAELLSELTFNASGSAVDAVGLVVAYLLRVSRLGVDLEACEHFTMEAAKAENADDLSRWSASVAEVQERLQFYGAQITKLVQFVMNSGDAAAMAYFVQALADYANTGADQGMTLLQQVMDAIPSEQVGPVRAAARKLEKEAAQ